jgi:hypothetical protein
MVSNENGAKFSEDLSKAVGLHERTVITELWKINYEIQVLSAF